MTKENLFWRDEKGQLYYFDYPMKEQEPRKKRRFIPLEVVRNMMDRRVKNKYFYDPVIRDVVNRKGERVSIEGDSGFDEQSQEGK